MAEYREGPGNATDALLAASTSLPTPLIISDPVFRVVSTTPSVSVYASNPLSIVVVTGMITGPTRSCSIL